MKYYFDVEEIFRKTIAIKADSPEEALKIAEAVYGANGLNIGHEHSDEIVFKFAQETVKELIDNGFVAEEELETFSHRDKIYTPREYLKLMFPAEDYDIPGVDPITELEELLDENMGDNTYWSYAFEEKDHCDENQIAVVLVDVSYYEGNERIEKYRWFEIDEEYEEEAE